MEEKTTRSEVEPIRFALFVFLFVMLIPGIFFARSRVQQDWQRPDEVMVSIPNPLPPGRAAWHGSDEGRFCWNLYPDSEGHFHWVVAGDSETDKYLSGLGKPANQATGAIYVGPILNQLHYTNGYEADDGIIFWQWKDGSGSITVGRIDVSYPSFWNDPPLLGITSVDDQYIGLRFKNPFDRYDAIMVDVILFLVVTFVWGFTLFKLAPFRIVLKAQIRDEKKPSSERRR